MSNPRSPMISLPLPFATMKSLWYSGAEKWCAIRFDSAPALSASNLICP